MKGIVGVHNGRWSVQLGNEHATVVGVMREGVALAISHELWVPLRTERHAADLSSTAPVQNLFPVTGDAGGPAAPMCRGDKAQSRFRTEDHEQPIA